MTNEGMNEQSDRRESTGNILSQEERAECQRLTAGEPPHNQRALALLALDKGATQEAAGQYAGLTKGQVRYWLAKFRKVGMAIFSEAPSARVEPQPEPSPPEVKSPAGDDPVETPEAVLEEPQIAKVVDEETLVKTPEKETSKKKSPQKKTKKGKKSSKDKGGDKPPDKKKDGKGNKGKKAKKKKRQQVKSRNKQKKKSKKTKGSKKGKKKKDGRARQGKKNKNKS